MDSGETSDPEDDAFDDDEERAGIPNFSASERYQTASDGYTRKRGSTSLRHLEDEGDLDNPRLGWLVPDSAHAGAATGTDGLKPGRKEWQVNVRLDRIHYASLKRAADVYGTTPTALADASEPWSCRDPQRLSRRAGGDRRGGGRALCEESGRMSA